MPPAQGAAVKAATKAAAVTPQGKAATVATKAAGKTPATKAGGAGGAGTGKGKGTGAAPGGKGSGSSSSSGSSRGKGSSSSKSATTRGRAVRFAMGRRWLLAELLLCVVLLVLAGVTGTAGKDGNPQQTGADLAIKGSALAGVFIVLGLVSAGGKGAERAAGALGCLITLAYMFNERDALRSLTTWANKAVSGQ